VNRAAQANTGDGRVCSWSHHFCCRDRERRRLARCRFKAPRAVPRSRNAIPPTARSNELAAGKGEAQRSRVRSSALRRDGQEASRRLPVPQPRVRWRSRYRTGKENKSSPHSATGRGREDHLERWHDSSVATAIPCSADATDTTADARPPSSPRGQRRPCSPWRFRARVNG